MRGQEQDGGRTSHCRDCHVCPGGHDDHDDDDHDDGDDYDDDSGEDDEVLVAHLKDICFAVCT